MENVAVPVARTILVGKGRGDSRQGEGKSKGNETCEKTSFHRRDLNKTSNKSARISLKKFP